LGWIRESPSQPKKKLVGIIFINIPKNAFSSISVKIKAKCGENIKLEPLGLFNRKT
jgi:hypothetical protein